MRYIERLDQDTRKRVEARIAQLCEDPYSAPNTKPLVNAAGRWSSRVGGLRIVFRIDREEVLILILTVGPRGQVYRDV